MRVRYGFYNGYTEAECDLKPKKAREMFDDLKTNLKVEWIELVSEEDEEGGYMEIIEDHYNPLAKLFFK